MGVTDNTNIVPQINPVEVDGLDYGNNQTGLTENDGTPVEYENKVFGGAFDLSVLGRTRFATIPNKSGNDLFTFYANYGVYGGITYSQHKLYDRILPGRTGVPPEVDCDFEPVDCAANNEDSADKETQSQSIFANRWEFGLVGGLTTRVDVSETYWFNMTFNAGLPLMGRFINGAATMEAPNGVNLADPTVLKRHFNVWLSPQLEFPLPVNTPWDGDLYLVAGARFGLPGTTHGVTAGTDASDDPFTGSKYTRAYVAAQGTFDVPEIKKKFSNKQDRDAETDMRTGFDDWVAKKQTLFTEAGLTDLIIVPVRNSEKHAGIVAVEDIEFLTYRVSGWGYVVYNGTKPLKYVEDGVSYARDKREILKYARERKKLLKP